MLVNFVLFCAFGMTCPPSAHRRPSMSEYRAGTSTRVLEVGPKKYDARVLFMKSGTRI